MTRYTWRYELLLFHTHKYCCCIYFRWCQFSWLDRNKLRCSLTFELVVLVHANDSSCYLYLMGFQLPVQSVPITTNVVNSNPVHGEVYSIQHYVIKFVRELRQVCGFPRSTPPIKLTAMIYLKYCWKWC
jgi:hypothetical protein